MMATNKNQHFVPRCYLRAFTFRSENAAISLFNLDRKKLIQNAPVKNQCSRDYFYGTDDSLESAIQQIESQYSSTLRTFSLRSNSLTVDVETVFKIFWLFQHLRTEAAALRAVQMAEITSKLADIPNGEFSLGIKEAVQMACRTFSDSIHEIDDLKFCIFKNKTKIPFITSDNPAILTNKWRLEKDRSPGHSFGMGSAGMMALIPLTPKFYFLGYDGDVYTVPHEKGIVEIKNPRDVIALNQHQFLQCVANIYVHDANLENMICQHFSDIESARPKNRIITNYAQFENTSNGFSRYVAIHPDERDKAKEAIIHNQLLHPNPTIWPSQIKIRKSGSVYTNGTGMGYVRLSRVSNQSTRPFWRERP